MYPHANDTYILRAESGFEGFFNLCQTDQKQGCWRPRHRNHLLCPMLLCSLSMVTGSFRVRTGLLPDSTQETGPHADHLALSPEQPAGTETFPLFLQEFASGHTVSSCLRIWVSVCQNPCQVCLSQPCCASPSQAQRKGGGPSHLALTEGAGARGTTDIPPSQHFHSQPRAARCLTKSAPVWLCGALSSVF